MSSNSSCSWPDQPGRCDAILVTRRVTASLSIVGCLFVIGIILLFRKYKFFVQRLILWLSLASLCDAIAYAMGDVHERGDPFCIFQAFWMTYFDWSVLLWVSCICFNLFWNVIKFRKTNHLEGVYHVVCWAFPLLMACIPFSQGNTYGPAGVWCWISEGYDHMRFGVWYGPLFAILFIMISVYIYIIIVINKRAKMWTGTYDPEAERRKALLKEDVKPLRIYPFVYLALNVFPLINRIQNAASKGDKDNPIFALALLHALSSPLQGALNAIVFGLDKETVSKLNWVQFKAALTRNRGDVKIYEPARKPVIDASDSSDSTN
ncbi:cyclic AMP receptor-like protein A [Oscarella lobularis]|uniref:cyclic AMP receptor-like protein A n=1 Tax=Oscarella lobularis TaxID=121494 RepID=UPI0033142345